MPKPPINGLGHSFGPMVAFAGIIFNGLFDKYPNLRIGFMEAGVSWLQTCLERFDRGWETHIQYDPRREYIQLQQGENVSAYVRRHIEAGRIFVGCEGTEKALHHLVGVVGNKPFIMKSKRSSTTSISQTKISTPCCTAMPSGFILWVETARIGGAFTLLGVLPRNYEDFLRVRGYSRNAPEAP